MASEHVNILGDFLRPYQRRFIEDPAKRIIVLKSRRIGMSEACILRALLEALATNGRDVYLTSVSFADAKELLERTTKWLTVLKGVGYDLGATTILKTRIEFANGSRIMAVPAKRVRGRGGTVIMDEVAFWQHARAKYSAIAPAADTDPSMRIIIVSTPWGEGDLYHEVWTDPEGVYSDFSRHYIDVYQAAEEGFPVDPEELRSRYSESTFLTEFMCEFASGVGRYFDRDLLRECQQHVGARWAKVDFRVGGLDLASSGDASVLATLAGRTVDADRPEVQYRRQGVLEYVDVIKPAGKRMDYTDQLHQVLGLVDDRKLTMLVVDANGEGAQVAQDLVKRTNIPVIPVKGGRWSRVYADVPKLLHAMERGKFKMRADRDLMKDFGKVQQKVLSAGSMKFVATRDADGHADRFFATILAYHGLLRAAEPGTTDPGRKRKRRKVMKF